MKDGLEIIGWYHSHPLFPPNPSACDVTNQFNFQELFNSRNEGLNPFIGLIISPYDKKLPDENSLCLWFVVESKTSEVTPYLLLTERSEEYSEKFIKRIVKAKFY